MIQGSPRTPNSQWDSVPPSPFPCCYAAAQAAAFAVEGSQPTSSSAEEAARLDGADALTTIAEVAVGLAGFSGVVAVLGRQPGEFSRVEAGRLVVLLLSSLGALFFALIPFALFPLGLNPVSVWRTTSGLVAVFALSHLAVSYTELRRVRREAPEIYSRSVAGTHFTILVVVLLLQLVGVAKGGELALSLYIFGLLGLLAVAAFQFVRILFVRPR